MLMTDLPFDIVELAPVPGAGAQPPLPEIPLAEITWHRLAWLPHEIQRLREMFAADEDLPDIAAALGRGLSAVRAKLWELGLRRNSQRAWTDLEDQYLAQHYRLVSTADIAAMLGRSCSAIYGRANALGLTAGNPPLWSDWELAQLRIGYEQGVPVSQIAVLIGRTASALAGKAAHLGIRHANDNPGWSDAERVECLRIAETGMLYSKIVEALAEAGFPPRTKPAIDQFLQKSGYRRGWGRPWTQEEEDSLRAVYARSGSVRQWTFLNARTASSVRWKVKELGLQGTHAKPKGFAGETWTETEIAILRAEYGKTKTATLARNLGRNVLAVRCRAQSIGLESGYHRPFTEDEDRAFRIAWASRDITFTDLAEVMQRDIAVIGRRAKRLGLNFSLRPHKPPRTPRETRRRWTLQDILALGEPDTNDNIENKAA